MNNCTIVVNTCDAYSDIWELFFKAFDDCWKGCEYEVVLNTEKLSYNAKCIKTHNFIENSSLDNWGKRLKKTLQDIDSQYIIMLYDDFILEANVNQKKIKKCIDWLDCKDNKNICAFYFSTTNNKNTDDKKFDGFERLPVKADYKLNSAPAIWRKKALLKFIQHTDSPWAWEFFGSYRAYNENSIFYSLKKGEEDIYPYSYLMGGAIYRGKWVLKVVIPLIEKYKININLSKRGITKGIGKENKRSLKWKIDFFIIGYKMIGLGVLLFIFRTIKKKIGVIFA